GLKLDTQGRRGDNRGLEVVTASRYVFRASWKFVGHDVVKEAELAQFGQIVLQQMMVMLTDRLNTQSHDRALVRISFNAGPGVSGCGLHCDGANREFQRNIHGCWNGSVFVTFISAKGRE